MKMALELAARAQGRTRPNPRVGAVVVRAGRMVGKGYHARVGGPHAEVLALEQAGRRAGGATLYVSLEPCAHTGRTPPCTEAIRRAGIRRVVAAMVDPNPVNRGRGLRILRRAGVRTSVGLLEKEARQLNEVFVTWMSKRRPFVTVKVAQSLDGKIASAHGKSRWISGQPARQWTHRLRREVDAILVGIETVLKDDPRLTVRSAAGRQVKSPMKILLDSHLRTPPRARLFRSKTPVLIAASRTASKAREEKLRRAGAEILRLPARGGRVDLRVLLRRLARREVSHLLIEGGGETIASALAAGVVDRICWIVAPKILGGRQAPGSVGGLGFPLDRPVKIKQFSLRRLGEDLLVMGKVVLVLLTLLVIPLRAEEEDSLAKVNKVQENLQAVEAEVQKLDKNLRQPGGNELVLAATQGNTAGVRLLMEHGADPNGRDSYGTSPLEAAALGGYDGVVHELIQRGADVNGKGLLGVTPLMLSAEKGYDSVARELIGAGADVNAVSQTGRTALMVAERNGQAGLVTLLKTAGAVEPAAPARPTGKQGVPERSELPELVSTGDLDSDLVDAALLGDTPRVTLLLRRGAHANARGSMGMTALMHAAQNGHAGVLNELLLAGADVNTKSSTGHTALACAAMMGQAGVIHTLVLWGADVHVKGFAGMTALMHAAQNSRTESARVLISWGADVNQGNDFGMTPLMFAAQQGQAETVKLLLEMGADPKAREKIADQTALEIAQRYDKSEVVPLLRSGARE